MAYSKKNFTNGVAPAIDADFLNGLQDEVVRIAKEADTPDAAKTAISEAVRNLYGLPPGDASVDKALQKTMQGGLLNALLTGFANSGDVGNILPTDTLLIALSKLNNRKTVSGTFTGDDTLTTINVGFKPTIVFHVGGIANISGKGLYIYMPSCWVDIRTGMTNVIDTMKLTNDGFKTGYITDKQLHHYVAIA